MLEEKGESFQFRKTEAARTQARARAAAETCRHAGCTEKIVVVCQSKDEDVELQEEENSSPFAVPRRLVTGWYPLSEDGESRVGIRCDFGEDRGPA